MKRIPRMTDKEDSQMRAVPQVKKKGEQFKTDQGKRFRILFTKIKLKCLYILRKEKIQAMGKTQG